MTTQASERWELDEIRAHLPCSIELPAGCGKTETITRLVADTRDAGGRSLVLTHTHAGVDALRRRFRRVGVSHHSVTVRTIDSWLYDLIRSFPQLSGIAVGPEPDWRNQGGAYYDGGLLAVGSPAIEKMLRLSYELLVVDEYQDCHSSQHALLRSVSRCVPTCVFGDRMQGLFFFTGDSVNWTNDVLPAFPAVDISVTPWRWACTNRALGTWLIDVRRRLLGGFPVDLSTGPLVMRPGGDVSGACYAQPPHPSRTAILSKWPSNCAVLAGRLGAGYTMIEEIEGRHLLEFADMLDIKHGAAAAATAVDFAVSCAFGVASVFNARDRQRIRQGGDLRARRFDSVRAAVAAINSLRDAPSYASVRRLLLELAKLPKFCLFRREAWYGVVEALRMCEVSGDLTLRDAVVSGRNKLRVTGRYPESRIIARPLLVKGLEFDNVVVTDLAEYDAHELYVCLTRASRRLTVVSDQAVFAPARPAGS